MAFLPMFTPGRGAYSVRKRPRVCSTTQFRCCTAREPRDSPSVSQSSSGINSPLPSVSDEAINSSSLEVVVHPSIRDFPADVWDALADGGCGNPFLRHHFLATLEDTGCACAETGWAPRHVSIRDRKTGEIYAAAPVYAKAHSMGEFIFDNSWAEASYATGIPYYPKLLVAPPFTPATGRRILTSSKIDASGQRNRILGVFADALVQVCGALRMSGCHVNFCLDDECEALSKVGFMRRQGVQYHFVNSTQEDNKTRNFTDFDDYLECFRSKRRSNIRRERRHVREKSRLRIDVIQGKNITPELLDEMFWIYKSTIDKMFYGRQYLTREFFRRLGDDESFKELLCFVLARDRDTGELKAGTFNVIGDKNGVFYGRYWGCLEEHKFLHFETCYYAAIEHVINNSLSRMEPGAGGGDFKFLRGFEPTTTQSMHYIRDSRLAGAVGKFLEMETTHIDEAVEQMIGESAIRAKSKTSNESSSSQK